MRRNTLAILAACAAVTICGQAQARQPAAAPAAVPDQMPFDVPYGNSITADRAADIVKAVVAEATNLPATGSSRFPSSIRMASLSISTRWTTPSWIGDDLAEQGPYRGALSPPDADIRQRDANSYRRLYRHAGFASADRIARRYSACRGRQDHRRSRLQRRDRRPGCGGLQGRRRHGEVGEASA